MVVRERATTAGAFDPAEASHGHRSDPGPPIALAVLPLIIVVTSISPCRSFVLPRMDASFLGDPAWGSTSLAAVGGVWAVVTALAAAIVILIAVNYRRLPALRDSMDAGANAAALPVLSVASLVGFGSVVAALPAFAVVRDWVLGIEGGPLVSLAIATNVLASLDRLGVGRADDRARRARQHISAASPPSRALTRRSCTVSRSLARARSTACRTTAP